MKNPNAIILTLVLTGGFVFAQGSLTPPGGPAPTMKSLDQIQPRTAISSLPFVIATPGSYYVTTNLVCPAGTNGITVAADHVSIDLNGFTLSGAAGFASSNGIHVVGTHVNLTVANGVIQLWKQGIAASSVAGAQAENLRISSCSSNGLTTGNNSIIAHCSAISAGGIGISAGASSTVRDCAAQSCTGSGIFGGLGSTIANCTANNSGTGGYGISAGQGCTIKDCSASTNTLGGISTAENCRISGCAVFNNSGNGILTSHSTVENCTVNKNSGDGIRVASFGAVLNNNCHNNGVYTGINIHVTGTYNRIEGNHCTYANTGFKVDTGGNVIIKNSAGANNYNYDLTGVNHTGAFVYGAALSTNSNPHANYDF